MIQIPVIYALFVILIALQGLTIMLLINKFRSVENLIKAIRVESKPVKNLEVYNEQVEKFSKNTNTPVPTIKNSDIVKDNQDDEDILFIKEIKLDRRSKVIDMDVQVNNRRNK